MFITLSRLRLCLLAVDAENIVCDSRSFVQIDINSKLTKMRYKDHMSCARAEASCASEKFALSLNSGFQ